MKGWWSLRTYLTECVGYPWQLWQPPGTIILTKTVETLDTCHILTINPKGDGWVGKKLRTVQQ